MPRVAIKPVEPRKLSKTARRKALEALWQDVVDEGAAIAATYQATAVTPTRVVQFAGSNSSRITFLHWTLLHTTDLAARSQLMALLSAELQRAPFP